MRSNQRLLLAALLLAITLGGPSDARAEVSAQPTAGEVSIVVLGIIEGPDPIPQVLWEPVRDVDPELYLNPEGASRGDGRPDVAFDPQTGWPHVAWAYNTGSDYDIAYSSWDGEQWAPIEFLTASATEEIDPRIFIDDDATYIVWWEPATDSVRLLRRAHGSGWGQVEQVGAQGGQRPSVATWGGTVLVAAERDAAGGGKEISLATRLGTNSYDTEIVVGTPQTLPLDVVLHSEQGRLWMDWRHSTAEFAYSEFVGDAWATPVTVPWTDDSWVKLEEIRLTIRGLVMNSP